MRTPSLFAAVAALGLAACSSGGSSGSSATSGGPPATSAPQTDLVAARAKGTLKGPSGTVTFNADGTATATLITCGTSSMSSAPFGIDCSGSPEKPVSGKVTIDAKGIKITQADGSGTTYQAYVDGSGKLHVGTGALAPITKDRQTDLTIYAGTTILHVHGTCTYDQSGGSDNALHPTPCHFGTQSNVQTLTATVPDEFEQGKTKDVTFVVDPKVGIVVDPVLWYEAFTPA